MTPSRRPRPAVSWAIIVLACAGIVVGHVAFEPSEDEADDTTRLILLRLQGKVLYAASLVQPEAVRAQLGALDAEATTPRLARAVAALRAAVADPADRPPRAALDLLEARRGDLVDPDEIALHDAVAVAVGDPGALTDSDRARIRDGMGWFGTLLLTHDAPADDPDRRALVADAWTAAAAMFGVFALGGAGVLAGIVLGIVAAVRLRSGGLRPRFVPPGDDGDWYLRAFGIYVGSFLLLQILPLLIDAAWVSTVAFGGVVAASALGAAWPVLRGVPAARAIRDLGLHRGEGVVREIACGAVGYVAILPIFAGGFLTTLALMGVRSALAGDGEPTGPISHPIVPMMAEGGLGVRLFVLFLAAAFAPFFEETLFRGALYGGLRRRLGPAASALATGVLFAAIHPQGWVAVPALAALAFGFALLREWRGSLIAPMVGHALHNGTLVAVMWLSLR